MTSGESRKRLTYVMLFRVGVVTLLLVATFISELAEPSAQPTSDRVTFLFALIAATYGVTILFAVWLQRTKQHFQRLALAQVATDLVLTTLLVHLSGGVESGFAFMYLITIVSSSFVVGRSALGAAGAAIALYVGLVVLRRYDLVAAHGQVSPAVPLREVLRVVAVNAVAFAATGALAARLAVELKRAGERIESQGTRLRDLAALHKDVIRCLTSGLITVTRDNIVITYNVAAADIIGKPAVEVVGRPIDQVVPNLRALFDLVPAHNPLRRGEVVYETSGAPRILGVSLSPLMDAGGNMMGRIVSFQDLTELRRMEAVVTRSERLAAVGRLAAGIAHEIRNPLAAISGSIELLAQGQSADTGRENKELMGIVLTEVSRLNTLITDLLDFARPRSPETQPLDLSASLGEMLRVFEHDKHLDGARVELVAGEPVWISADAGQLRQVMWNLLRNAAQASPPGAAITVEVDVDPSGGDKRARVKVRDRGPGIPPEHRAHIFEPFFSTKKGGTGLGLATVHRIVEEHHGQIEIEQPQDGGTAFTVRLPLAPPA